MIDQQSRIHGLCHHKVACPFSPLLVKVGKLELGKKNKQKLQDGILVYTLLVSREK